MSKYSVKKVLRIYEKWGCVIDPWLKKAGRCKTFNGNDMEVSIIRLALSFVFIV